MAPKVVTLSRTLKYLIGMGGWFLKPGRKKFYIPGKCALGGDLCLAWERLPAL